MTEITLSGLAYGGDAFGRDADGKMIFVPFALPGERVKVEIIDDHQRWAQPPRHDYEVYPLLPD